MNTGTLGLHILGDRAGVNAAAYAEAAEPLKARYHVVVNNQAIAQMLIDDGSQVIYRRWKGDTQGDDRINERVPALQWVRMLDQDAPPGALLYLVNEPDKATSKQLNDWTIVALRECERLGRKGVILNFSTGNPEPEHWHPLANCLLYAREGGHILGLHEYFDRDFNASKPWHVDRWKKARELLGDLPPIVMTEVGSAAGYDPKGGWRKSMSPEAYAAQLNALTRHYAEHGIHACVFAHVTDADPDWGSFSTEKVLIPHIRQVYQSVAVPGNGEGISARLKTVSSINLREQPGQQAKVLVQVRGDTPVTWYPSTERRVDGLKWVRVDAGALKGWMANVWGDWSQQFARSTEGGAFWLLYPIRGRAILFAGMDEQRPYGPHEGIDWAAANPSDRIEIVAAQDGMVSEVDSMATGFGHYIKLRHDWPDGKVWHTYYAHLESRPTLKVGAKVKTGDVIGIMGSSGRSSGKHLHLTLVEVGSGSTKYWLKDVVDPMPYIRYEAPAPPRPPDPPPPPPVEKYPFTPEGHAKLVKYVQELEQLIHTIIDDIFKSSAEK